MPCSYTPLVLVLIAVLVFVLVWNNSTSEGFRTSYPSDVHASPGYTDYEVMAQLPLANSIFGSGERYHAGQVYIKDRYPRNHIDIVLPSNDRYGDFAGL